MTLIGERYRLVKPIATGGMGTVWEAWDERLQRRVAIKQLHPSQPGLNPEDARVAAERVLREARNAARLHHPHAVPVYDVVEDEGRPSLVMQFLPAPSLQHILATRGPLDAAAVARIGSEVASALEAAHQVGIVHRDVKPANVLVEADGAAKLTDFGISHALGDSSLTSTGLVTGTPAYLAPEVARGAPASPASDVFSLGSTLYTALEGVSPFGDGQNAMATLHRAASGQITPPRRSGPLTPVLERMLAVDPARRPTMAEAAQLLRQVSRVAADPTAFGPTQWLTQGPPPGPPPSSTTVVLPPAGGSPPVGPPAVAPDPSSPARRRRVWPILVGLLIAGAVLGGLVALLVNAAKDDTSGAGGPTTGSPRITKSSTHASTHASTHRASKPASKPVSHPASRPSTPQDTSSAPSTPDRNTSPASGDPAAAVVNYYGLLPGDTDSAWNLLTTKFQNGRAGGRTTYDAYWASIQSVSASNAQDTGNDKAEATITYVYKDGRTATERTEFRFKQQDGVLKIDDTSTKG